MAETSEKLNLDGLVQELKALNAKLEAKVDQPEPETKEAEPATEPSVTQTDHEAINLRAVQSREKVHATEDMVKKDAEIKALQEQLDKFRAAEKEAAQRALATERKAEYSIPTIVDQMHDAADIPRGQHRSIVQGIQRQAVNPVRWMRKFGNMTPLDVLYRGYFEPSYTEVPGQSPIPNMKHVDPGAACEPLKRMQDLGDKMFAWSFLKYGQNSRWPEWQDCPWWEEYAQVRHQVCRALDTTDFANFVPTAWSAQVVARYDLARNLTRYLRTERMPRTPYDLPVWGARVTAYSATEQTDDFGSSTALTTSDPTDLKVTLALHRWAIRTDYSYDIEEDSLTSLAEGIPMEHGSAMAYWEEYAIINGDTAATHQDADVAAVTAHVAKDVLGFRAMAIDNSYTTDLSTFNSDNLIKLQRLCGVYGGRASEGIWIIGSNSEGLVITMNNSGGHPVIIGAATSAPVASGQTLDTVGMLWRRPVVISEAVRENLNTAGIYDGTTLTKTTIIYANRMAVVWAYINEQMRVEVDRHPHTQQVTVVTSERREFEFLYTPTASHHTCHLGINVPTT